MTLSIFQIVAKKYFPEKVLLAIGMLSPTKTHYYSQKDHSQIDKSEVQKILGRFLSDYEFKFEILLRFSQILVVSWDEKLCSWLHWFSTVGFLPCILCRETYFLLPQSPLKNAHHFNFQEVCLDDT